MSCPSQPFPLSPPHLQALLTPSFFPCFFFFIDILLRQPRSLPTQRIDGLCLQGKVPKNLCCSRPRGLEHKPGNPVLIAASIYHLSRRRGWLMHSLTTVPRPLLQLSVQHSYFLFEPSSVDLDESGPRFFLLYIVNFAIPDSSRSSSNH